VSVEFVDPRGIPTQGVDEYRLRLDPTAPSPVFGILANGFADSEKFAAFLGDAIVELRPDSTLVQESKGDVTAIVGGERLERMTAECSAVIGLFGH
jgi:hypothetical protein